MISVHDTSHEVAAAVAAMMAGAVTAMPAATIGLAGGSTPKAAYEQLTTMDVDWSGATLWLGDERWVAVDDPDSNAGMVRRTLGGAASRLVAPDYTLGDPHEAAAAYAATLAERFAGAHGRPGLVLLGMGDDGHTASLFPGTEALDERNRSYVANWVPDKGVWRLTATLPLLWAAEQICFLVTGEAKAEMIRRILEDDEPLPAQQVAAGAASVTWFLDAAAASRLTTRGS
jgi:6-phosphogluconolactonase